MGVIRKHEEEERDAARARGRSAFVKEDILDGEIGQCTVGIEEEEEGGGGGEEEEREQGEEGEDGEEEVGGEFKWEMKGKG